ncbi:MAG: DNA-3-methyladenine glycosylase [bacterium]
MRSVLSKEFFNKPTVLVAEQLLGMYLVVRSQEREIAYIITETEAYDGHDDKASHASKGRTSRTEIMFGPAGVWYVYLIYGMYWMLNIVTGEIEYPAAVLIRGVENINGPGKLTREYSITKRYNGMHVDKKTGLWIEDRGVRIDYQNILRTERVGVQYAGHLWANKPYRFILKSHTE